jgi:cell division protein FtsW
MLDARVAKTKTFLRTLLSDIKSALLDKGELIELGRKHRPKYSIVALAVALAVLGFIMVFSAAPGLFGNIYSSNVESCNIFHLIPSDNVIDCKMTEFLITQTFYLIAGLVSFLIASRLSINFWRRSVKVFLILSFGASLLLIVAHLLGWPIAIEAGGAVRWLNFGIFTFQPAELMKFALLLFVGSFLASSHERQQLNSIRKTLLPLMAVVISGLVFVVVLQSDLSSGIVILAIVLAQLIISGMKIRNIGAFVVPFLAAGLGAVVLFPYRVGRIMDFLGQQCVPGESLDQICSALMSMGSGGAVGRGLGQSLSVFWVPQIMDDAVFSLVGETFGFVGAFAVLMVFAALLFRILNLADYLPNMYLRLVVAGAFGWVASQTIINIGAFTGTIPLTGITLPFISSGGSSLICVMGIMGVVFTISRYTNYSKIDKKGELGENSMRRRGLGRSRYTDFGDNR